MKLTDTSKKTPPAPPTGGVEKKITEQSVIDMVPLELRKWQMEHREHHGQKTSAWAGLQWENCKEWFHIECSCGSTFIQHKRDGEVTIEASRANSKRDTKNETDPVSQTKKR